MAIFSLKLASSFLDIWASECISDTRGIKDGSEAWLKPGWLAWRYVPYALPLDVKHKDGSIDAGVVIEAHPIGQCHGAWQILQASGVATPYILLWHVVAAICDAIGNAAQVDFDAYCGDKGEIHGKAIGPCMTKSIG